MLIFGPSDRIDYEQVCDVLFENETTDCDYVGKKQCECYENCKYLKGWKYCEVNLYNITNLGGLIVDS